MKLELNAIPQMLWTATPNGSIDFCNKYWIEFTGIQANQFQNLWTETVHPDDIQKTLQAWNAAIESKELFEIEHRLKSISGNYIWFQTKATPVRDENNEIKYWFGTDTNIEYRKQNESKLHENLEYYTQLYEVESDAIFLIENQTGKLLTANISACQMYQYTHEELMTMKNTDLSAESEETQKITNGTPVIKDNVVVIPLRYHKKKDGTVFPVEITGRFFNLNNKAVHIAAIRDISHRRQTEDKLRASEEKYKTAFWTSPDSININKLDGTYVDINEGFTQLTGYTKDDVIGKSSLEIKIWVNPNDREKLIEGLKTRGFVDNLESIFRMKDGTTKTALMSARILQLNGEAHILSITRDISDRKKVENALKESESKYKLLADNISDVLWVYNLSQNKWEYISPSITKLRGLSVEEAMSETIADSVTKESYELISKAIPQNVKLLNENHDKQHVYRYEIELNTKDKNTVWVEIVTHFFKNSKNEYMIQGTSRDISERRMLEKARKESEELFRSVVQNSTDLITLTNSNNDLIFASSQCEAVLGIDGQQYIGKRMPYVLHPEDKDRCMQVWNDLYFKGQEIKELEYRIIDNNKSIRWLSHSAKQITHLNKLLYIQSTIRNITQKVKMEIEKKESQTQLFHASKLASIGTMAAGIAHEINNPLYFAIGYLDTIMEHVENCKFASEDIHQAVKKQEHSLLRIKEIIGGLRLFTRAETDEQTIIELNKLITDTILLVEGIYSKEKISIIKAFDSKKIKIKGNFGRFNQVLLNIISNAHDAVISSHKTERRITIEVNSNENNAIIIISDNGIGIPQNKLSQIFDPFFTTKDPGKGTGIGLSIARSIINEYNGDITIDSKENLGTTVRITLPINNETPDLTQNKHTPEVLYTLKGKALVVDDEEEGQILISRHLKKIGLTTETASTGEEAINKIKESKFDYLVTDMKMPGMDGIELIKIIHINRLEKNMKIVILTGAEVEGYSKEGGELIKKLNIITVIKPATKEDLFNALNRTI